MGKEGSIIKPGSTMTCEGLGMPFHKTSYKNGNLFVTFKIAFPDSISESQAKSFTSILDS